MAAAGEFCPLCLDRIENIFQTDSDSKRLDDELLDFLLEELPPVAGSSRRRRGDDRADAGPYFEPAFLYQVLNDFVRCVRVNLQLGRQRSNGWERMARLKLAADERLCDGKNNLIENRQAGTQREFEWCHMRNVTQVSVPVKSGEWVKEDRLP
jgi:hypothetical protein